MKKLLTLCFLSITSLSSTLYGYPPGFNANFSAGYRQDELDWSTRDPLETSDPITKIKWEDLQIADFNLTLNFTSCNNWYFRANGDYGRIYSGHAVDSDYAVDIDGGKPHLLNKNHANAGRGDVFDVSGVGGYVFKSSGGRLAIAPVIGYTHSEQHLHLYDAKTVYDAMEPIGPLPGVHSTYKTRWYGGVAGYDLLLNMNCNLRFYGIIQAQMGNYRAKTHWNLRDDIDGFVQHRARFVGYYAEGGVVYNIFSNHYIGISGTYRNLWTHHGEQSMNRINYIVDRDGLYTGQENYKSEQKLRVRWLSWSIMGNWIWHF